MAKTKALISFAVTEKLICVFVFAYTKSRFSHDAAHTKQASKLANMLKISAIIEAEDVRVTPVSSKKLHGQKFM